MDLDVNALLAGLLVSSIGFVLFSYGRKMRRVPHVMAGLILLVYPYFISNVLLIFVIAALLCTLLWLAVRAGH